MITSLKKAGVAPPAFFDSMNLYSLLKNIILIRYKKSIEYFNQINRKTVKLLKINFFIVNLYDNS